MNRSVTIFETALAEERPVNALLGMAYDFLQKDEIESLHDIDVMLNGRFIDYMRNGVRDDFDSFIDDILGFLDSGKGDKLKSVKGGERYYHRWEHFHDLCNAARENYDPQLTLRFISSKKQGAKLMNLLFANEHGLRHKTLAENLGISQQNLSKLLREFKEHGLVEMNKEKRSTFVKLTFLGRVFEKEAIIEKSQKSSEKTTENLLKESETRGQFSDEITKMFNGTCYVRIIYDNQ